MARPSGVESPVHNSVCRRGIDLDKIFPAYIDNVTNWNILRVIVGNVVTFREITKRQAKMRKNRQTDSKLEANKEKIQTMRTLETRAGNRDSRAREYELRGLLKAVKYDWYWVEVLIREFGECRRDIMRIYWDNEGLEDRRTTLSFQRSEIGN